VTLVNLMYARLLRFVKTVESANDIPLTKTLYRFCGKCLIDRVKRNLFIYLNHGRYDQIKWNSPVINDTIVPTRMQTRNPTTGCRGYDKV